MYDQKSPAETNKKLIPSPGNNGVTGLKSCSTWHLALCKQSELSNLTASLTSRYNNLPLSSGRILKLWLPCWRCCYAQVDLTWPNSAGRTAARWRQRSVLFETKLYDLWAGLKQNQGFAIRSVSARPLETCPDWPSDRTFWPISSWYFNWSRLKAISRFVIGCWKKNQRCVTRRWTVTTLLCLIWSL